MEAYLEASSVIDFHHPLVAAKAKTLAQGRQGDEAIAEACFLFVRDEIAHAGDVRSRTGTCKASEVLEHKVGWCYAKSHLLAALLRASRIPAGLCYQRLSCSEYTEDIYCLHGLNAVYLREYGWYRIDPRGNKAGVDARFDPPHEKLAFSLGKNEYDLPDIYTRPLDVVVEALTRYPTYEMMAGHFPDHP